MQDDSDNERILLSQNDDTGEVQIDGNNSHTVPDGPFKILMKLGIRTDPQPGGEEYMEGWADCEFGVGRAITDGDIQEMGARVLAALPADQGFRFMTRQEFASFTAREMVGMNVAVPMPKDAEFRLEMFNARD